MVIWLIGLSGSGKTTIGKELYKRWKGTNPALVFLDGDILRDVWGDQLGHSLEARAKNAHRISHLCALLDSQGIDVVATVLSIFPKWQQWNRQTFSKYHEVFLNVPLEELRNRDPKGLYQKAFEGTLTEVVGVDIPFPLPQSHQEFVLEDFKRSAPELAMEIMLSAGLIQA